MNEDFSLGKMSADARLTATFKYYEKTEQNGKIVITACLGKGDVPKLNRGYGLDGNELWLSLNNLYQSIRGKDDYTAADDIISWCQQYAHPYYASEDIEEYRWDIEKDTEYWDFSTNILGNFTFDVHTMREDLESLYRDAIHTLPILLSCKEAPDIPKLSTLSEWLEWIDQKYIPLEPSMLGPGSMSNAPDRLDGFHYNRCCRKKTDKGRSDANLASYSKDRRAFENWSDGNWITANMLMGYIKSNPALRQEPCANFGDAHEHPLPCDADHIGPISLGFCHRPEFQLLCSPCNSAKNNRLYFSDVQHLIAVESTGETVTTWYATPVWNLCKNKVTNAETALRLSKIMRDNRNIALMLLSKFMTSGECLFLLSLLNLQYADYQYQIIPDSQEIYNHIVTVDFTYETSSLRYVTIQKRRKIRIAFESLSDYATKDNRNGFIYNSPTIEQLKSTIFDILSSVPQEYKILNSKLCSIISNPVISDNEIESFLNEVDYNKLLSLNEYVAAKEKLYEIMSLVAQELSNNWDSARYSREIEE